MYLLDFILIFCLVLYDQWCYGFPYFWTLNWMKCWCIWSDFAFWKLYFDIWAETVLGVSGLALRNSLAAQCNPPRCSARWQRWSRAEEAGPLREAVSFSRRRPAEGSGPLCGSASSLGIWFQWTVFCCCCLLLILCSDCCWIGLLGILPCLWSIYSCLWFPFLVFLIYWFLDSLPGSWFVFIVEMNTLFGCFELRLEYGYVMVVLLVLLEVVGWIDCATIDYWLLTLVFLPLWLGWLPLWLDFGPCYWTVGPCDWTTVPVIGLRSLWLGSSPLCTSFSGLTLDFWLLTMWFDLVWWLVWLGLVVGLTWFDGWFWGFGGWSWGSFLVGYCESFVLFGWYLVVLVEVGWFLLDCCSVGISVFGSLLYYAFVVEYWLCLTESWLLIRSTYCCWVSVWTIEQFVGVYILYGCVNLFISLCISISPCGCEWWLLSILLLMVLCVFSRYGVVWARAR